MSDAPLQLDGVCGGLCLYDNRMCDECRADPNQHIYRLLCGWCATELPELDAGYCSEQCRKRDEEAMDSYAQEQELHGI